MPHAFGLDVEDRFCEVAGSLKPLAALSLAEDKLTAVAKQKVREGRSQPVTESYRCRPGTKGLHRVTSASLLVHAFEGCTASHLDAPQASRRWR